MPYEEKPAERLYLHEEYPKMLTEIVGGRVSPVLWPANHPKGGLAVIFENEAEEQDYFAAKAPKPAPKPKPLGG